jgi:mono/diheme cytochrome c family protein
MILTGLTGRAGAMMTVILWMAGGGALTASEAAKTPSAMSGSGKGAGPVLFERDVKPILAEYCFGCHGNAKKKGDLTLEVFAKEEAVKGAPEVWEKVMKQVSNREMPPKEKSQPTIEQRNLVVGWITDNLFPCDCDHPDPGRVTIHRFNRAEYNNTIRDLLGVDFKPAEDFPADDAGYGFDNIGDVLSMPTILLEKYLAAAERILDDALVTDRAGEPKKMVFTPADLPGTAPGASLTVGARLYRTAGDIHTTVKFPRDGGYVLRAKAYGEQIAEQPARMVFLVDDEPVAVFEVSVRHSEARDFETTVQGKPGLHRFAVAFLNDRVEPADKKKQAKERHLVVQELEVEGPFHPGKGLPETHRRIFYPARPGETPMEHAREILTRFAFRAYRRPPAAAEIDRLMKLAASARKEGDTLEKGVQVAMEAVLISPHFLFREEIDKLREDGGRIRDLDDYELASRLSYFLWSSMPDAELLGLARLGVLHERRTMEEQVRRMLRDPKSGALVENFGGQWLQIRNLANVAPDASQFTQFNEELRGAMRTETEMFLGSIAREDRSILEMIAADYTYLNEPLARLYGIEGVEGEQFRRVVLKSKERGGLLTQASVLTVTSNPTRTSPVKRGRWVLDNILGTPPPPPPPDVPPLKESSGGGADQSLRVRMEIHRKNPGCASCHSRMDPIGFGLENFDAIGAWRAQDGKFPVDASGILPDGATFNGPSDLKRIVLSRKEDFVRCVAEKMLTYALGRGLEYYDKCAVERICEGLKNSDYRFSALVVEIVESVPFRERKGERELHGTQMADK